MRERTWVKRRQMGTKVWAGGREVAGKVSSGHLFLYPQAEKADTAPRTQGVQTPASVNRRWPSEA